MSSSAEPNPAQQGFLDKHLSLIITSIISLAAVAVTFIQFYDARASREADLKRQQEQHEQSRQLELDREKRELSIRLANFISENQDKVFSKDPVEQARIRELIAVAFREDAEHVFKRLASVASDEESKQGWRQAAGRVASITVMESGTVIAQMFSDDKTTRIAATTSLIREWRDVPGVVPEAVGYAYNNRNNKSGVINVLVYLQSVPPGILRANRDQIDPLLNAVRGNGGQTAEAVDKVRARMD